MGPFLFLAGRVGLGLDELDTLSFPRFHSIPYQTRLTTRFFATIRINIYQIIQVNLLVSITLPLIF